MLNPRNRFAGFMVFCLLTAAAHALHSADSLNCALAGRWVHGPCDALALKNRLAVFGDGLLLSFVDFRDFSHPVLRGEAVHASPVRAVAVDGTHAYAVEENETLRVYDYSDPDHPAQVGSAAVGHYVKAAAVSGSCLYLACYGGGLYTYDVSTPSDPAQVSWFDTQGSAEDVAVQGDRAYVANYDRGLQVLDVADPAHPVEIGFLEAKFLYGVAVHDQTVYAADGSGFLRVIDVSDPSRPRETGSAGGGSVAFDVAYGDGYAYVNNASNGMKTYDVRDPLNPQFQSTFRPGSGNVEFAAVEDSLLIVNVDYGNLIALNVADRTKPAEIGRFAFGWNRAAAFSGSTGFVASGTSGVAVIDFTDPGRPRDAVRFRTLKHCTDILIEGNRAYVADGASGLLILDITDPALPVQAGLCNTPGFAQALAKMDNRVYVADRDSGLCIIDVTDPADPVEIGRVRTAGEAWDVAVQGSTAYVADQSAGLSVIDVSDPAHPAVAGSLDMPGECTGVATCGAGRVILAAGSMAIVDVEDPSRPVQTGVFGDPGNYFTALAVAGPYAYLADASKGLCVVDISDPASPVEAGVYDVAGVPEGVALNSGLAYLLCGEYGLHAVRFDDPAAADRRPIPRPLNAELAQNFPNPFNPETTLPFTVRQKGRVTLTVRDAAGRLVGIVFDGELPAGRHAVPFHAHGLASGVYVCRLETNGFRLHRKMLVLK